MNNPTPNTPILDDDAVAEIEKRIDSFPLSPLQARALCDTVRALRAEMKTQKVELLQLSGRGELLAKVHVNFDDLDPVAAVRNEFDRLRNIVIRDLQSQLERVTKDRDAARTENERLASQLKEWQEEKDTKAGYL